MARQHKAAGKSATTRREVLAGALTIAGWVWAVSTWPPRALAQGSGCGDVSGGLIKLGEVRSRGGKLRAIMSTRSKVWNVGDQGANQAVAERALRYFQAKDADSGNVIWPPVDCPRPVPGPTLRARVGDRVEITFLNHIDVRDFPKTGIDRGDKFPPGDNRGCDVLFFDGPGVIAYPGLTGDAAANCFHGSSTTNIHFHGTHVTPDGLGDNVLLQLRPDLSIDEKYVQGDFQKIFAAGPPATWADLPQSWRQTQIGLLQKYDKDASLPVENRLWPPTEERINAGLWPQYQVGAYAYCYDIPKYTEDAQGRPLGYRMGQCPGTHWYHAHKHGSTAINVMNGMVGAFIIEGEGYDDALAGLYPNLRDTEKVMVIHNIGDRPNMAKGNITLNIFYGAPSLLVNGQLHPTVTMQPGEVQLWRMINATIKHVTTVLAFDSGPEIRQIAQDGVQFSADNYAAQPILNFQGTGKSRPASFAPGNRMDILVKAPMSPGTFVFKLGDTSDPVNPGNPIGIFTLRVEGNANAMAFPTHDNYPSFPPFLKDITASDVEPSATNPAKRRSLEFGWQPNKNAPGPDGAVAPSYMINKKKFSGDYDQEIALNAVEEWTLTNTTAQIAHPFHIHINPFQVVEIFDPNAPTPETKSYKPSGNHIWQDVIAIPPATFKPDGSVDQPGRVTIRHRFVDFVGSYVLHCHMLAHEDRGMMQLVRVAPKDELAKKTLVPQHH